MDSYDVKVREMAEVNPDRLPELRTMCRLAAQALPFGRPNFDPEAVRMNTDGGTRGNMTFFVKRGLVEVDDRSRQHRMYDMWAWQQIKQALRRLDDPG